MGNNWLVDIFSFVLQMSITSGMIICIILALRFCLRKAPKIFSYLLWSVVLFRLLCPVTVQSQLSVLGIWQKSEVSENRLLPGETPAYKSEADTETMHQTIWDQNTITSSHKNRQLTAGNNGVPNGRGMETHVKAAVLWIGGVLWIIGMVCMAGYGLLSTIYLKKRLAGSTRIKDNIYISDCIDIPFAMGIIAPKIYLPGFLSEKEKGYIILHEKTHIRRGDLIVKLLSFAALSLHWFNPLVWIAFLAAEKDMEMSCDEMVMKQMKEDIRAEYSMSLLCLATGETRIGGTPLAFGEGNTKSRIKNIMRYKKPAAFVIGTAVVLVTGCLVGFGTDPKGKKTDTKQEISISDSEKKNDKPYERVYSVELNIEKEKIPFEIWVASEADKRIKIDGQEISIDPEFAANVKYEQIETTAYYDFTGDGKEEIALIDTGGAAGGAFQTVQVFERTGGQWKEIKFPSDICSNLPGFVEEKLKELDIHVEPDSLACRRTVSLSYENKKIRMNYKLYTDDLTAAVGTIHKEAVYAPGQKKFEWEEDTLFTPALSGESAYHNYENVYTAELETGREKTLFEIWAGSASGDKVIRIDGQELWIDPEAASGKFGGIVETEVYDYTGDGNGEIVLVDCGSYNSLLIFGNANGKWEEMAVPVEVYSDDEPEFWKQELKNVDIKIDDSVYPRYRSISLHNEKILIGYHLFADTVLGPDEIGTIQKELVYLSGKKQFVWGETSFIPPERSENDLSDTVL